jgi:hypothetical protein
MFIGISRRPAQAPKVRHVSDVAPSELPALLRNAFYKHYAPPALRN